ncbi:MAG: MBL fold metallo-hydrolase [Crenarchaeota archaeon]|nr:MBL fold metallo-hydrolase [Thermoproteota archaeon]
MSVEITFLGGAREVGRAAYWVKDGKASLLLDYGVSFDEEDRPIFPEYVSPKELGAVVLSHAHLDHSGALPMLYTAIRKPLYMTKLTKELTSILINDFLKLSGYYVTYGDTEVKEMMESVRTLEYRRTVEIPEAGGTNLTFYDAGHIPGSAMVKLELPSGVRLLYTGDVRLSETQLLAGADVSGLEADVLLIEATYGKTDHPPRENVEALFVSDVREVIQSGGTVLVPAFGVGRGQEILAVLADHEIDGDVYLDGMVRNVAELLIQGENKKFLKNPEMLEKAYEEARVVKGWQDRRRVWRRKGVIIASAGMLRGGPALYYARKMQSIERDAIFLVSFQAPGTPGRRLVEEGRVEQGGPLVSARVQWFDFSSHAGAGELLEIVRSVRGLKKVVVVHSEEKTALSFAERVREETGLDVIVPKPLETIKIEI